MESWKRIVLWIIVAALVLSFAVCQKKMQKANVAEEPKATEIAPVTEEAKPAEEPAVAEEKKPEEKPAVAEEEPAKAAEKPKVTEPAKPPEAAPAQPAKPITRDNAAAIIELKKGGRIVIEFYPEDAPNTVDNFIKLANKGFYDGLTFHRVEPGFVVQGGCPLGTGYGGPGYTIKAEFNSRKHLTGTVAMARGPDPDSAGSQFYICLAPAPFLDGEYTVFGQTIEGMDLVKGIVKGDVMKKVTIVDKATVKK
jgi:cyclophilin family peptidyl-prolyl cis-trans isomerase